MVNHSNDKSSLLDQVIVHSTTIADENAALIELLEASFPETFNGRTFYKQRPHTRLMAMEKNTLVGQVGLEFRAITVGGEHFDIMGIIDLCTAPSKRNQGIGSLLLAEAEKLAKGYHFSILFSDNPAIYFKNGYKRVSPAPMRWFAIDELQSHSVMESDFSDCFVAKQLTSRSWPTGKIDLLGYLF